MATKKPSRRQRRRGDLPAGFQWRDGRPRWVPSPTRRKQGWRGVDLQDAWKRWLAKGPAIERAQAIVEAVEAWAAGQAVPSQFAAFAPKGADVRGAAKGDLNPRSVGALLDAYRGDKERGVIACNQFRDLSPRTQADYRNKLNRFLEVLVGSNDPKKIAAGRALSIDHLLPPPAGEGEFELLRAYELLRTEAGDAMASGVHACVSAWLGWCVRHKNIWPSNPAELVRRKTPEGRIVVYDWPELVALVRQAEAVGLASIADAIILAVDLSWSQQDLLALTWGQVSADNKVKHRRIKTGVAGNPPLLKIGRERIKQIRARWTAQNAAPTPEVHVLICELTGKPWAADTFRHKFSEIRDHVAKEFPSIADKQFRDLRDTAITYCVDAGIEQVEQICSRTLHSPTRASAVISKHYGAIRQAVADKAAKTLDAHFEKMGYSFEPKAQPATKEG